MRRTAMAAALGFWAAACDRPADGPRATEGSAAASASQPVPAPVVSASAPTATPAPPTAAPAEPSDPADASGASGPAPVGGTWLSCYGGFRPRADPKLDVTRLGLLCGPINGMKKVSDVQEAELEDGGTGREHRFAAEAGDCYRIFAVGEPSVEDLDVEVFDPSRRRVAFDTSDDRWPIVQPDRPFCVTETGEYRARVRAQRGAGRYAIEIWRLR